MQKRQEIVKPMRGEFTNRWPALFQQSEVCVCVCGPFRLLMAAQLQFEWARPPYMFYTPQTSWDRFSAAGGVQGKRIKDVLALHDPVRGTSFPLHQVLVICSRP